MPPSSDRSPPTPVLMVDEGLELRQTVPEDAEEMFAVVDAIASTSGSGCLGWTIPTAPTTRRFSSTDYWKSTGKARASTTRSASMADSLAE